MTNPQKRSGRKSRLKKINISPKEKWKSILKDVNKDEVPIPLLLAIGVNLIDGTKVNINIKELLDEGQDPNLIEELLDRRLKALDSIIVDIDFYVSIDKLADTVQPITDEILKDL